MRKPHAGARVLTGMKCLGLVLAIAACGGKQPPTTGPGSGSAEPAVKDTRTAIEKRRDEALEKLGPKITACAVADARADLEAGRVTKQEFDLDTSPKFLKKHTETFIESYKVPMSSRQVRVLEVCFKEEQECGPLADCLTHLNDKPAK